MLKRYAAIVSFQVGTMLAALVSLLLISHHVSPEQYGRYSLWLSVVMFGSIVGVNWTNAALLLYGRKEWGRHGSIGETLATRLLLYIASFGVIAGLLSVFSPAVTRLLDTGESPVGWLISGILLVSFAEVGIYANQAMDRSLAYGVSPCVGKLAFLLGILLIPLFGVGNWKYLAQWLMIGAGSSILVSIAFFAPGALQRFRPTRQSLVNILRYSWSVPLGAAAAFTVNWVDAWVIKAYRGYDNVGLYAWAYQITAVGGMAFASLSMLLTPMMIDAFLAGDRMKLREYWERVYRLILLVGFAGLALLPIVYPLLSFLMPAAYSGVYLVILILLSAIPFQLMNFLMNPVSTALESLVPLYMLLGVFAACVNVLGDLLLVPRLGMTGAAAATWFVFLVAASGKAFLMKRSDAPMELPSIARLVTACSIMPTGVLALWLLGPATGAVACLIACLVLLVVARRAGIPSRDDLKWLGLREK